MVERREQAGPVTTLEQRVLAIMPSAKDAERTVELLAGEGVACAACDDLPSACRELLLGAGLLLVAEEMLLRDRSGQLTETLARQPAWSVVPVIVLGRGESDNRIGDLVREAKAQVTLVERPVRTRTLVSVVKAALRARANQYEIRDAIIERERQASLLRDREERLEFALTAGRLGAWELDLDTRALTCSELCKAAFGRGATAPFTYRDLEESTHPDDRACVLDALRRTVETGADYDVEYRNIWPNGEVHWVLVRGRPLRGTDGTASRLVGVSLDVTDKKRAEEELTLQAEQLREAARRKDEFLATLAHELRNPLAPVRTGLSVLDHAPSPEAAARTRDMMERQLAHMVRLIDDLLDVSRITSGKVVLRREPVLLRNVVDIAIEANRPILDGAHHELSVSLPGAELLVEADATRLAQVIGNLLNNAIKYTPPGGRIVVASRREGAEAVIEISDNGLGIPSEHLERVFEMFNQVNRTLDRAQGGLGIGLALVRELVTLHGGTVRAESAGPGHGSTFTVRLPLAETRHAARTAPEKEKVSQQRRVLVVDDNIDAAQMLAMLLDMYGHETRTAHTGAEALDAAATFKPEVVFLDIGLPGMNGYEVARRLRNDPAVRGATLVALTGWGTEEDKSHALEAGFDYHLTKPVETTAIDRVLSPR
jgi:PAS domain S-box-containing protein